MQMMASAEVERGEGRRDVKERKRGWDITTVLPQSKIEGPGQEVGWGLDIRRGGGLDTRKGGAWIQGREGPGMKKRGDLNESVKDCRETKVAWFETVGVATW